MFKRVGFIGLGDIGLPMAKRVLSHGYQMVVCGHVRRQPVEEMKKLGAEEGRTPKEVALSSDLVITMVRDEPQSEAVIHGPEGVMEGAKEDLVLVIMSTLSPQFCHKVAEAAKEKRVSVLDVPVSGASQRAAEGTLTLMAGGDTELVEKCRPVLETMGTIVYCGGVGAGQIAKLANNIALENHIVSAVEAISWALRCGVNEEQLVEIMKTSSGNSWVIEHWFAFKGEFKKYKSRILPGEVPTPLTLGVKDLEIALRIADDMELSMPLTALSHHLIPRLKSSDAAER